MGRRRYISDPFATSVLEGNGWSLTRPRVSDHTPAALLLGKTRYQLYRWLGGPRGWSGRAMETLSLPGFDPRIAQPLAGRHKATLSRPSFVLRYKQLTTCLSRKGNSCTDNQFLATHDLLRVLHRNHSGQP